MRKSRKIYYQTFEDDVVTSGNQEYVLPEDYLWIREKRTEKLAGKILYGLASIFGAVYGKCVLGVRFKNKDVLKNCGGTGFFLYGNI